MISAAVVILTAGYILWAIQRVYLGAEYKGPHGEALTPMTAREFSIAVPLLALAIAFGVYPKTVLQLHAAVGRQHRRAVDRVDAAKRLGPVATRASAGHGRERYPNEPG